MNIIIFTGNIRAFQFAPMKIYCLVMSDAEWHAAYINEEKENVTVTVTSIDLLCLYNDLKTSLTSRFHLTWLKKEHPASFQQAA